MPENGVVVDVAFSLTCIASRESALGQPGWAPPAALRCAGAMASLWIINKAGGLIFQSEHFDYPHQRNHEAELTSNDYLILAGTLHGIHAITSRIVPAPDKESQGFHMLEAENFVIHVKMTETGTKFVLLAPTAQANAAGILQRAYELYVEHVMKNPFYIAEMPIRVEAFDREIHLLLR